MGNPVGRPRKSTTILALVRTIKGKPSIVKIGTDERRMARELQRNAGAFDYDGEEGRLYTAKSSEGVLWSLHSVPV